jgi:Flp pilus assembly protein TadG
MDEDQLIVRSLRTFWGDHRGAGAVEFALTLPALMFLFLGTINAFLATYADVNLHSATEKAARWASIQAAAGVTTPTQTTVSAYAKTQYIGPGISDTYTYTTTGTCGATGSTASPNGYAVTSTATYQVYYGFGSIPFHLRAAACFPNQVQPVGS